MEEDVKRNLKTMRMIAIVALLVAFIALVASYVMYVKVSAPLKRIQTEEIADLQSKVNFLVSSRLDGRMDVELQFAILNLKDLMEHSSGDVNTQAQKALIETQALLDTLRKARAIPAAVPEKEASEPKKK